MNVGNSLLGVLVRCIGKWVSIGKFLWRYVLVSSRMCKVLSVIDSV